MHITDEPGQPLLFFVRGRGRGHAQVALSIAKRLAASGFGLPLRFVSYAAGAEMLREAGWDVIDLGLPEGNTFVETVVPVGRIIREQRPRSVVAHEEFAAPAAASILDIRSVFLTDWFSNASHSNMRALEAANEILFIDEPGAFEEPAYLRDRIRYVGAVLRDREYGPGDRARARKELGVEEGQLAIGVFVHPGRRGETVAPVCGLLLTALDRIAAPQKLFWLSGADDVLAESLKRRRDAVILGPTAPFDRLMAACDLAFTKGNRNIVLELATFGVPTISFSHGLNRIDDIRTSRVEGNSTLAAARLTAETLAEYIRQRLRRGPEGARPVRFRDGAQGVAERLIELAAGCA